MTPKLKFNPSVLKLLSQLGVDVSQETSPFLVGRFTCHSVVDVLGTFNPQNYLDEIIVRLPEFVKSKGVTHVIRLTAELQAGSMHVAVEWANAQTVAKPHAAVWDKWGTKAMAQDGHDFYPEGPNKFRDDVMVALEFVDSEQRPFRICYTEEHVKSNAARNGGTFCPYLPLLIAPAQSSTPPDDLVAYSTFDGSSYSDGEFTDDYITFDLDNWFMATFVGAVTPDDGVGYFATDTGYSKEHPVFVVRNFHPSWATTVVWFNK